MSEIILVSQFPGTTPDERLSNALAYASQQYVTGSKPERRSVPDHQIVLDHASCDHGPDDTELLTADDFCCPTISAVVCSAPDDVPGCRFGCDECSDGEGWEECDDPTCEHRQEAPHCSRGHVLKVYECSAAPWLTNANSVYDVYDGEEIPLGELWHDGAITVFWMGSGYTWDYAATESE